MLDQAGRDLFTIRFHLAGNHEAGLLSPPLDVVERRAYEAALRRLRRANRTLDVYDGGRCRVAVFSDPPFAHTGADELVERLVDEHRTLGVSARVGAVVKRSATLVDTMTLVWRLSRNNPAQAWLARHHRLLKVATYGCVVALFATTTMAMDRTRTRAERRGDERVSARISAGEPGRRGQTSRARSHRRRFG